MNSINFHCVKVEKMSNCIEINRTIGYIKNWWLFEEPIQGIKTKRIKSRIRFFLFQLNLEFKTF